MQPDSPDAKSLRKHTIAVTAGRPEKVVDAPVVSPITMTSVYIADADSSVPSGRTYARSSQPTWEPLEESIAALEGGGHAVVFASGTAAMDAALAQLPGGGTLILHQHLYAGLFKLAEAHGLQRGLTLRYADLTDTDAAAEAIASASAPFLVWAETSTNPMIEILDVPRLGELTHARGGRLVVDNTFCTPLITRPLEHGADIVVHSVTKYLSGHSDLLAGAVVTDDDELAAGMAVHRTTFGGILGPQEAWLALRGIRTLGVRLERAQQNAAVLAERLAAHPAVGTVYHPSLPGHPGHELAARLWEGFGAMLSFDMAGPGEQERVARADAVIRAAEIVICATSLGGVETSWERRHRHGEPATVPESLIRVSVGIEDIEDLWQDIRRALDTLR